jgi:2-polyprenyl-6-methoxyphenol hydroxylase-like FAD-dependent oxidoreductase
MIIITTSALHTPKKWPGFMERARKRAIPPTLTMKKFNGDVVGNFNLGDEKNPSMAIYRSKLHKVLHEYASFLGIPIEFSTNAVDYFETEDHGGVGLADGRKLTADIVVAADGVGSKSWHLVGEKTAPISSGYILYRVTFPAAPALGNPTIKKEFEGVGDRGILHAGPGAHMVTCLSGDKMCWMLTCKASFFYFSLPCRADADTEGRMMATKAGKAGLGRLRSTKPLKRPVAGNHSLPKSSKLRLAILFSIGS